MYHRILVSCCLLGIGLAMTLPSPEIANAQAGPGYRRVEPLSIQPSPSGPGLFDILVPVDIHSPDTRTPADVSTVLELRVNGTSRSSLSWSLQTDGPVTGDCALDCGTSCGGLYVDGVLNTMTCHEDSEGDCQCGYWIKANFPDEPLQPGDEIMVILYPAPGALPEDDNSDDQLTHTFDGTTFGWNREVAAIAVNPSPAKQGHSFFDITYTIDFHAGGAQTFLELSTEVQLFVNGLPRGSLQAIDVHTNGPTGDCESSCGSSCGSLYVDGVINTMTCHEDGPGDCDCGHWFTGWFPSEPLVPGDEIMVILYPAPGALPEGDESDDRLVRAFSGEPVGWNRSIRDITVLEGATAGDQFFDVFVEIDFHTPGVSGHLDLSTQLELRVNGISRGILGSWNVIPDGPSGDCALDCVNNCGGLYVDGVFNTMTCHRDAEFDCSCGYWITAELGQEPLMPGDEIMVILYPAPGAVPDSDGGSDVDVVTFDGGITGWNRALTGVQLVDMGGGLFDIQVDGTVAVAGKDDYRDLSFELLVEVGGSVVTAQTQGMEFIPDPPTGPSKLDCQLDCSGGGCGSFKADPSTWIAAQCLAWPGLAGCSCGAAWTVLIPSVPLPPVPELKVLLIPVPGALPELPGFEEDDERRPPEGTGVDTPSTTQTLRLDQNHPNPFNPSTSIAFRTSGSGPVLLDIYNTRGQRVRRLVDDNRSAGEWVVRWDGLTDDRVPAASGHYFYRLSIDGESRTRKMTLLK